MVRSQWRHWQADSAINNLKRTQARLRQRHACTTCTMAATVTAAVSSLQSPELTAHAAHSAHALHLANTSAQSAGYFRLCTCAKRHRTGCQVFAVLIRNHAFARGTGCLCVNITHRTPALVAGSSDVGVATTQVESRAKLKTRDNEPLCGSGEWRVRAPPNECSGREGGGGMVRRRYGGL